MPRHAAPAPPLTLASVLLAVLALLSVSFGAPSSVRADGPIDGIDVSHWQEDIDWTRVRAAGKTFAFLKASMDVDFVDPKYGLNRARATAAGLIVGAYHFAKPTAAAGDAVAQADHFLDTARIADGDLPPVLDLEQAGGLKPTALIEWVKAYLGRIHERTGVRGTIYTSPNFWKKYLADTDWFAMNGHRVLWIAHWTTVPEPTVPASDWAGFGWTFWQYTSSGSVPGIAGRVDLDRFDGTDLAPVLIEVVDESDDPPPAPPFKDINFSTFADDIAWLHAAGITSGCSPTAFCPGRTVTRGEMASFLARALQLPKSTKDHFTDDEASSHEANINRLASAGLAAGCATKRYCPKRMVTRAEVATFIARVLELSPTARDYFRDDADSSHEHNINRIARAGLTNGCGSGRYCPTAALKRGQMAAFLHRTFGY